MPCGCAVLGCGLAVSLVSERGCTEHKAASHESARWECVAGEGVRNCLGSVSEVASSAPGRVSAVVEQLSTPPHLKEELSRMRLSGISNSEWVALLGALPWPPPSAARAWSGSAREPPPVRAPAPRSAHRSRCAAFAADWPRGTSERSMRSELRGGCVGRPKGECAHCTCSARISALRPSSSFFELCFTCHVTRPTGAVLQVGNRQGRWRSGRRQVGRSSGGARASLRACSMVRTLVRPTVSRIPALLPCAPHCFAGKAAAPSSSARLKRRGLILGHERHRPSKLACKFSSRVFNLTV